MKIIKANGDETFYDPEKIIHSLKRAGADQEMIQEVLSETERELYEGIHTKALYKILYGKLKKLSHTMAGKYHLKNAIMALGPTGFPFEKFIAAMLEAEGYRTITNQIVLGHCVKHEIDVIAAKDNQRFILECKFHSYVGNICDVKVALYVYARFLDVEKAWLNMPGRRQEFHQGWVVTNTRLSGDAEQYGQCVGLGLLSWNFPKEHSLRERIDRSGLYPITCLSSLSKQEIQRLLNNGIVLCQAVRDQPNVLNGIGLSNARKDKVLEETNTICKNKGRKT